MNIDVYSEKDLQSWSKNDLIKHILFLQVVALQTELENFKTVQTNEDMNKKYIDKSILLKEINDNIAYYTNKHNFADIDYIHKDEVNSIE